MSDSNPDPSEGVETQPHPGDAKRRVWIAPRLIESTSPLADTSKSSFSLNDRHFELSTPIGPS
jgi:hypothetical protein